MSEQHGSTLARKLANVMGEVSRVKKSGRNDFHKYDYATESDLTDAIRGKLAEQGVAIYPSVVEVVSKPLETSKRGEALTTATLEITLVCADSGEKMVTRWQGQGLDAGDKGYYKAYTGAMKYFLMKTFLISTGDDPEQDDEPAPKQRQAPKGERSAAAQQAAALPVDEWESLMRGAGLEDLRAASAACAAGFNKSSVRELEAGDLAKVNRKLAGMTADARREYVQDKIAGMAGKAA